MEHQTNLASGCHSSWGQGTKSQAQEGIQTTQSGDTRGLYSQYKGNQKLKLPLKTPASLETYTSREEEDIRRGDFFWVSSISKSKREATSTCGRIYLQHGPKRISIKKLLRVMS